MSLSLIQYALYFCHILIIFIYNVFTGILRLKQLIFLELISSIFKDKILLNGTKTKSERPSITHALWDAFKNYKNAVTKSPSFGTMKGR